jgi:hypothetical protein
VHDPAATHAGIDSSVDVGGCFRSLSRGSMSLVGMAFVTVSERD